MSPLNAWYLLVGAILLLMVLTGSVVERLPFTPAIFYLGAGYAIGSGGPAPLHPVADATLLRALSEIAIAVSLFAVGLKLRVPLTLPAWRVPLRLAAPAMVLSIVLLAVAAAWICALPFGVALVLAAILAPTDPVLGADVHVARLGDRDYVRFGVSAEGGINDGLAFPAVMLGLGVIGRHELGPFALDWLAVGVVWFVFGGALAGWLVGDLVGRLILYLRSKHNLAVGLEEFFGFGVIGLAFGLAGRVHASEFLAVFVAGLALRQIERRNSAAGGVKPEEVSIDDRAAAVDPDRAAAHLTGNLLAFNTQIEHIAEMALVTVVGLLLAQVVLEWQALALAAVLFFGARPLAVALTLAGTATTAAQTRLIAWFGIRGIGSLYYLALAIEAGIGEPWATRLASLVLSVMAISIVVHGISATPLMQLYTRRHGKARKAP